METILDDDDEESSAEAMEKRAVAARAESNLMESMLCGGEEVAVGRW